MANQIADNKQRIHIALDKSLIAQIDGRAAADGSNRTAVIVDALTAYFDGGAAGDAAAAKLDAIAAKLDAMDAAQRLAVAGVLDAVKNQPIQVQQQQLPAPELNRENVTEWLKENEPGAVVLDAWGTEIKTVEQQPKGRFQRALEAFFE